jgi:hypothetical protein
MVLRLPLLEDFLEFSVGSEIDSLVGSYSFVSISCRILRVGEIYLAVMQSGKYHGTEHQFLLP